MSKFLLATASIAVAIGGLAVPATPALAQAKKVSEIIVYGTDPCPRSTDDEVVVCARKPESERYRIPEDLRPGGTIQQRESWTKRIGAINRMGATGIGSCSSVGPAGYTGCALQDINDAAAQRKAQTEEETAPKQ